PVTAFVETPWELTLPSGGTIAAVALLAVASTAMAYVLYFRILAAAGAGVLAPSARLVAHQPSDEAPARVRANADRIVGDIVGLRPYRKSGFVLKRERAGRRTIIHNYGHGGCGVTLSWGCAQMSAELAGDAPDEEAAVIGGGVMGLTTAHRLLREGRKVTVYADALPPDTTSNVAGAFWFPTTLFQPDAVSDAFLAQFRTAARLSYSAFRHLAGNPHYGVYWLPFFELYRTQPKMQPSLEGDDLYAGKRLAAGADECLGFPYAVRHTGLMIDPEIFLPAVMREIEGAGGRFVRRRFKTPDQIFDLKQRLIFNCTGLGAGALFGDSELTPVRGQLTLLAPQSDLEYGYVHADGDDLLYMFPRRGSVVLGGTNVYGEHRLVTDAAEKARILNGHAAIADGLV
ncbi:MAG: FAD-dependent oxidoreductase, partial [Pseudomonadota bacterium]